MQKATSRNNDFWGSLALHEARELDPASRARSPRPSSFSFPRGECRLLEDQAADRARLGRQAEGREQRMAVKERADENVRTVVGALR
jgi:hypothetical protein